jgi:hypothetical protein
MSKDVFFKEYDGESIVDIDRDVSEAMLEEYNEKLKDIPKDKHGFQSGKFRISIRWLDEN